MLGLLYTLQKYLILVVDGRVKFIFIEDLPVTSFSGVWSINI